jgi:lipopolysaccharide export system permease protein
VFLTNVISSYIGRNFLIAFVVIFAAFLLLILMIDTIELMRRSASKSGISMADVVQLALLKLPHIGQKIFPFAILFAGIACFWRLTRSHELEIIRAAGISAWQFLLPILFLAFFLGVLQVTVLNPISSATLSRFEKLEASLFKGKKSLLSLSPTGLWLRQASTEGQSVLHAQRFVQQGSDIELSDVVIFLYKGSDEFTGRIDADSAKLEDGFWNMQNAWLNTPEEAPNFQKQHWLETDLTLRKIQDSFAAPETMSFWALPGFIKTLEEAGFSAVRHRLYWHSLLAAPLLMCAMVLIAATFALRQSHRGGTSFIIGGGVMTGFVFYFFSDVVFALGLSDSIPATLAAWTPSGVMTLLGLAMLLHLEDG